MGTRVYLHCRPDAAFGHYPASSRECPNLALPETGCRFINPLQAQGEAQERGSPSQARGSVHKQETHQAGLGSHRTRGSPNSNQNLKSLHGGLNRFSHLGLKNILLSQGYVLDNGSHRGNGGRNAHFKEKGKELAIS